MTPYRIILSVTIILLLFSCADSRKARSYKKKEAILLADREPPAGWIYLSIYADSTFYFMYGSKRSQYFGNINYKNDTIYFNYENGDGTTDYLGNKAVIEKNLLYYLNNDQKREMLTISINRLKTDAD